MSSALGRGIRIQLAGGLALAVAVALGSAGCESKTARLAGHLERGDKFLTEEKYPEAILEYKNVLQLNPNEAKAHYGLARSYLASKQAQRAFWELQETVRLDPSHKDARLEYAQFLLLGKAEDLEEAVKQADAVLEKEPDSLPALVLKGRALQSLERFEEAEAVYELAME